MKLSRHMEGNPSRPAEPVDRLAARILAFPAEPLEAASAEIAAGGGDKKAASALERWSLAKKAKARMAAVCATTVLADYQWNDGRVKATRYQVGELGPVIHVEGREIREDWRPDPQALARALHGCGVTRGIHRKGGRHSSHVYGCGSSLCPDCNRRKATRRCDAMTPRILGLAERGYQIAQLTITQPLGEEHGRPVVLVNAFEEKRHRLALNRANIPISSEGYAVSGEGLGVSLDRLRGAMTSLRDGNGKVNTGERSRDWWHGTVAGNVYGIEWTGHKVKADPTTRIPRWHVHAHLLVIFHPGVDLASWMETFRARWLDVCPGASVDAQDLRALEGGRLKSAIHEVLKYPFKPAQLTHAQLMEVLASTKGRRFHLPGGFLHGNSKIGRAVSDLVKGDPPRGWEDMTARQRQTVVDLAEVRAETDEREPVQVAYRPRRLSVAMVTGEDGRQAAEATPEHSARASLYLEGEEWIPVTAAHLAHRWIAGDGLIDLVLWWDSQTEQYSMEALGIGETLIQAANWRGTLDGDIPDG